MGTISKYLYEIKTKRVFHLRIRTSLQYMTLVFEVIHFLLSRLLKSMRKIDYNNCIKMYKRY